MNSSDETQDKDIVVNAANAGDFSMLTNALKAADMVRTLKGMGPFTLFAPTDTAFRRMPRAKLEALLKDPAKLAAVINGHVLAGNVPMQDLKPGERRSLEGAPLVFAANDAGMTVNGARVARQQIESSNGVIHPIDRVIPPAPL